LESLAKPQRAHSRAKFTDFTVFNNFNIKFVCIDKTSFTHILSTAFSSSL